MSLIVRRATRDDIEVYSKKPLAQTIRAIVGEIDGKIVALGGVYLSKGRHYAFVDLEDECRKYKMTIARHAIRFLSDVRRSGVKFVYACRDETEPGSLRWLTSLGFKPDPRAETLFQWRANSG